MKRLVLSLLCATMLIGLCSKSALADKIFGTEFAKRYANGTSTEDWQKTVKKAKCYLCHVKGKKKAYCNTYGDILGKHLDVENFDRDRCKTEPEKVCQEIQAALEKVEAEKDVNGKSFADLFKSETLPDKEMGTSSQKKEAEKKAADDEEDEDDND